MFTKTFTSPHGIDMVDAVFEVSAANLNKSSHENFDYRISVGLGDENRISEVHSNTDLRYQMYYWKNAAARDAFIADPKTNLPMILANTDPMGEWFSVNGSLLETEAYSGLSAEAMAEKHCQEVILA